MKVRLQFFPACILIAIQLFLFTGHVSAQRVWEEDVIYLRNGSVIRGQIIEQKVGESVKIRLIDGFDLAFSTEEIDKITREPAKYSHYNLQLYRAFLPIVYRSRGIYQSLSFGLATNETSNQPDIQPSIHYRAGYHLNQYLNIGAGTGLDPYEGGLITALYADIHGDLLKRAVTPHYMLNLGYGIGSGRSRRHDVFNGGLMAHGAIGLNFHTRKRREEWIFTVGFKMQDTYQEFEEWPDIFDWQGRQQVEPAQVKGNRRYQKIVWQVIYAF